MAHVGNQNEETGVCLIQMTEEDFESKMNGLCQKKKKYDESQVNTGCKMSSWRGDYDSSKDILPEKFRQSRIFIELLLVCQLSILNQCSQIIMFILEIGLNVRVSKRRGAQ